MKLCLDTGHIAFGGGDPLQVARSFAERIGHVHLKDIRLDLLERFIAEGKDYVAAAKGDVFVALGQGDVDIPGIFDALRRGLRRLDHCGARPGPARGRRLARGASFQPSVPPRDHRHLAALSFSLAKRLADLTLPVGVTKHLFVPGTSVAFQIVDHVNILLHFY